MLSFGNSSNRASTILSSPDIHPLPQCLPLELITLGTRKYTRLGELRRVLGVSLGSSAEEHSFGVGRLKPPPPVATEELKNYTDSLQDTSRKARDRAKTFGESISKLNKYMESLSLKKRQRSEFLSNERSGGANFLKMGSQLLRNSNDHAAQKLEDKTKSVGLSLKKRIRTSMVDVQAGSRATVVPKQLIAMEKDRDALKAGSLDATRIEEKTRRLPPVGEGWDTKIKRKRSVAAVGNRAINGERDTKCSLNPKPSADTKLRSCDAQGFRSRSLQGMGGTEKLVKSFEPANPNSSAAQRNELESVPPLKDRTSMLGERAVSKGNDKFSLRGENTTGSAGNMTKPKVSRAPRTGSIMIIDSSPDVHPSLGSASNHSRSVPAGSDHQMAQWVGQRPHKISRTRRANVVSPVFDDDKAQISCQGSMASDLTATISSHGTSGSLLASCVVDNNPKFNVKLENVLSPVGLSEGEELRGGQNNLKEKGADIGGASVDVDHKGGVYIPTSRKNKGLVKRDGLQGQGRIGRVFPLTRPVITQTGDKLESSPTTRQLHSTKRGSDKNKSKPGRPPSKNLMTRKPSTCAGHAVNSCSADLEGEFDDGEELIAASISARKASHLACSSPFWKKMDPLFTPVSSQDASYLKQQLSLAEELNASLSHIFGDEYNDTGIPVRKEAPIYSSGRQGSYKDQESVKNGSFGGGFDMGMRLEKVPSLYQRVLSALIEDDTEDAYHQSEGKNVAFQSASDESYCGSCNYIDIEPKDKDIMESEVESEVDLQTQKLSLWDRFSCNKSISTNTYSNRSISSSLCNSEQWQSDDGFSYSQNDLGAAHNSPTNLSSISSSDCQYEMMSLDDRLLLELQSVGLYPETMPDLAEGEEGIDQDILKLQEGLYQQVGKLKKNLGKIDEVIQCDREEERRDIEQVAMERLVEMAYKKQIACRGSHSSRSVVRRVPKQVASAFVKRTLARCRNFEDTGKSCFSEAALHDFALTAPSCNNDGKTVDYAGSGTASNKCNEVCSNKSEARGSGTISSTLQRRDSQFDYPDIGSDILQPITHSSEQASFKHEAINKGKRREVLLDDVLGSSHFVGAKGKRSERERDQNRGVLTGRGSFRSDRRSKAKPKQKTNHLSGSSGNGNRGRYMESINPLSPPVRVSNQSVDKSNNELSTKVELPSPKSNFPRNSSKEVEEEPINCVNLQPNEDEDCNMLNLDDDGLLDWDGVGLDAPMDDLFDIF